MKKLRVLGAVCGVFLLLEALPTSAIAASFSALWPVGFAKDVSADGSVVVGGLSGRAVRWQDGMITYLTPSGAYGASAYGVSADGSMVVGRDSNNEAFLWT